MGKQTEKQKERRAQEQNGSLQIAPLRHIVDGCFIHVEPDPEGSGGRSIVATHPSGHQYILPLPAELAREVAGMLLGGIEIARGMPEGG